jgi:MFS family permease
MTTDEGGGRKLGIPKEMRGYTVMWAGQLASLVGSGMTMFALLVRTYQLTGLATAAVLVFFFAYAPRVIMSPLAGAAVDRFSRKKILILADAGVAASTLGIMALFFTDNLAIWHIYVLLALGGTFGALQWPAFSAATTLLVPKEHLGRASGMLSTAWAMSEMMAPIMAAVLLGSIGLGGILIIDIATFLVAIGALAVIHIPSPPVSKEGREAKRSWWKDTTFGFRYIFARRSLLGLLTVFFTLNFILTIGWVLFQPMILARTGNDTLTLGLVLSIGGIGGIVGGTIMTFWGGPKRRVNGVLVGMLLLSLGGVLVVGLGRWVIPWAIGIFVITFLDPIIMGSSQSIWLCKVPPDLQGRVFSARMFIALIGEGPAMLIAGPLADRVFEPMMADPSGGLEILFGSGSGAGMAVIIVISAIIGTVVSLLAYSSKSIRNVEDILPDHDEVADEKGSEQTLEEGACQAKEGGGSLEEGSDELRGKVDVTLADDEGE